VEAISADHLVNFMNHKYTDDQLLTRVETKAEGFTGWKAGVYDIWVRSTADLPDKFDDVVYTFLCSRDGDRPIFVMKCTGTSNAGSFGLLQFRTYNKDGCAVLKSDCLVEHSHAFGYHKQNPKNPAYVQVKDFPYYRDNNMNLKAEEIGIERHGLIGANCHKAGKFSTIIYNWSVACLVRNVQAEFDAWLLWMNHRPLSVCILKEF